jgi:hypothetical protein
LDWAKLKSSLQEAVASTWQRFIRICAAPICAIPIRSLRTEWSQRENIWLTGDRPTTQQDARIAGEASQSPRPSITDRSCCCTGIVVWASAFSLAGNSSLGPQRWRVATEVRANIGIAFANNGGSAEPG